MEIDVFTLFPEAFAWLMTDFTLGDLTRIARFHCQGIAAAVAVTC